jgi:hypothetical protein
VIGGDAAEQPGIVDKGTEEIHRMHQRLARWHAQHCSVVGRVQTDQHVLALDRLNPGQGARQHGRTYLGAAATTTHGQR